MSPDEVEVADPPLPTAGRCGSACSPEGGVYRCGDPPPPLPATDAPPVAVRVGMMRSVKSISLVMAWAGF